ncbi:substance-K receptor-like [Acropora muricata]|uniref:somatostatin receptor type 2-like n=1 Tax=Acropora millepora TaxID=45264 RepID=UPI0010FC9040|nr:somatostatin receptor type 2-like [Acropora millepora]
MLLRHNNQMMTNHSQQQNTTSSFARFSAPERIAWLTVFGMEAVITVTLSALTIIVYLKERSLRKRTMYLVINQAVADMFVGACVIVEFWELGVSFGFWKIHHFSEPFLSVNYVLWFVFSPASFTNLAAISLERTHATFHPLQHRLLNKKISGAVIAAVWITSWPFATIRLLYEIQISNFEQYEHFLASYYLLCLLCLLIIVVSYSSIGIKIVCGTQPHHEGAVSRERRLTKTLFVVTVVSFLLALPFVIFASCEKNALLATALISHRTYLRLKLSFVILFYANSLVNPIIYAFRMAEFRRALFSVLHYRAQAQSTPVFHLDEI